MSAVPADRLQDADRVEWLRISPFLLIQAGCLGVFVVGWSPVALAVALALYAVRMFAITAFYHRYFSHRAFRAPRAVQFVFALVGNASAQRGPLWWAAHHRRHHRHTDTELDPHSPRRQGLLWSHVGWFTTRGNFGTDLAAVPDLARYPELRWLDRNDWVVPLLLAAGLWGLGAWLEVVAPALGTSGAQLFVWGFCVSTTVLFHVTFSINSLAHRIGTRRYDTPEDSRNHRLLALLTFGEGWHNNHHRWPHSAAQGFFPGEWDLSHRVLRGMQRLGLVSDLRPVPAEVVDEGRA